MSQQDEQVKPLQLKTKDSPGRVFCPIWTTHYGTELLMLL